MNGFLVQHFEIKITGQVELSGSLYSFCDLAKEKRWENSAYFTLIALAIPSTLWWTNKIPKNKHELWLKAAQDPPLCPLSAPLRRMAEYWVPPTASLQSVCAQALLSNSCEPSSHVYMWMGATVLQTGSVHWPLGLAGCFVTQLRSWWWGSTCPCSTAGWSMIWLGLSDRRKVVIANLAIACNFRL